MLTMPKNGLSFNGFERQSKRNLDCYFLYNLVSEDLMKSIIELIQNDRGDKEILMRILNDLRKDKKPLVQTSHISKPLLRNTYQKTNIFCSSLTIDTNY